MKRILIIIAALALSLSAWAQGETFTVRGTVTDEFEFPLIGAAVMVPGTNKGVVTDIDGKYTITLPVSIKELTFSYLGYVEKTARIPDSNVLNVSLEEMVNRLDEAISIGYTTATKGETAGAVQNISLSDTEMRILSNTQMLLQGKAAGLNIIQNSDQPGTDDIDITIRGMSSVDSNTAPLIIVDGVEGDLSRVNPRDIKSISILKDASSAAIYGNRAASGVIVVETKNGLRGVQVNYSGAASVKMATALPEVVEDPLVFIDIVNEAWANAANGNLSAPKYSDNERQKWIDHSDLAHQNPVDWKSIYYKPGYMQTHHVSASGAGDRYNFVFSTGYQDQTGIVYSTEADKIDYNLKFNLNFFEKKLQLGANISGYETTSHEAQSVSSMVNRYLSNRPVLFFKAEKNGEAVYGQGATAYAIEENGGGNDITYSDLSTTFSAIWTPNKKFTFKALYNIRNGRKHTTRFMPQYELAGSIELNSRSVNRSELTDRADWTDSHQLTVTANYRDTYFKKLKMNLLAGYEMIDRNSSYEQTHIYDLIKNAPIISYGDPNTLSNTSSGSGYSSISTFVRNTLDWDTRYILELNMRYDGSSKFLEGSRFGLFPSAAFAWRVNREPWMKRVKWVDNLKLRASYGHLGNNSVSNPYTYADRLSASNYYSFGGTLVKGTAYNMFSNPYTTWENVYQANVGIDFDFLNAFTFTVDVFDKEIKDMLCTLKPVLSLGTLENGAAQNVGSMRNRGIEVSASWSKLFPNRLWMSVGGNMSYIANKVLDLGDAEEQWHDTAGNIRSVVGYPTRSRFGYRCIGLYQIEDFTWQNDSDPTIPHMERQYALKDDRTQTSLHQSPRPGDLLLEDQDGDNIITPNDLVYLGRSRSNLVFSFNFALSWKHFDLQMLATGQGYSLSYLEYYSPYSTSFTGQVFTDIMNHRWTEETPQYRSLFADKERADIVSTYDMHNGAYLRLKNLQLGYTFSGKFLDRNHIKDLRVYVSADNLLTFSAFPVGFDPERSAANSAITSYPIVKTISGGLTLSF